MSKKTLDAPVTPERDDYKSQLSTGGDYTILDALGFIIGTAKGSDSADLITDALNEYDPGADTISPITEALLDECADEMDINDLLSNAIDLAGYDVDVLKLLQDEIARQADLLAKAKAADLPKRTVH